MDDRLANFYLLRDPPGALIFTLLAHVSWPPDPVGSLSAWIAERDPLVVLDKTRMILAAAKASHMNDALASILDATEWMPRIVARSFTRLALTSVHPASLVVTNVRGPAQPLYLLEAALESAYPIVPLLPGHTLNVAVLSQAGRLFWTFHADACGFGDLAGWSKEVQSAFEEIHAAATRIAARDTRS